MAIQHRGPPNNWSQQRQHLYRKMQHLSQTDLIENIIKWQYKIITDRAMTDVARGMLQQQLGVVRHILEYDCGLDPELAIRDYIDMFYA